MSVCRYLYIISYHIIFIINSEGSITGMSPHQKMEVMPNTDCSSNNSTHACQVGPDTHCSLLLTALLLWGPHTHTLLGSVTHFQESTFFLIAFHTHQSSLCTFIHASRCVFRSHVSQSAQVKVHNEPPQPPYFHSWHPCMIISPSPEATSFLLVQNSPL